MENGKHVILIVDDDPDYLLGMRTILENAGYAVLEATTVEEGIKVFRESRPDLVLVDLMMEEIDAGTRFVREIRAVGGDVPVYLHSSVGDTLSVSTDPVSLGFDGVFQKPVDSRRLLDILKKKLG